MNKILNKKIITYRVPMLLLNLIPIEYSLTLTYTGIAVLFVSEE